MSKRAGPAWTLAEIKQGIDQFYQEYDFFPTAKDFDSYHHLPSSRQIQRAFGGLEKLRTLLGYEGVNYTKGNLRTTISNNIYKSGMTAEDYLEELLINKFGEPYVHTQKKYYKKLKNRYDFFVYCVDTYFGVDVFATTRAEYINANVRHKLLKYKNVPLSIKIYFVVSNPDIDQVEVDGGIAGIRELIEHPNIVVLTENQFINGINQYVPLKLPDNLRTVL